MSKQEQITIAVIVAIVAAFLLLFKKELSAYLAVDYDHYIDDTSIPSGSFLGYVEEEYSDNEVTSISGGPYTGTFPTEDISTKSKWVLKSIA
jgi:hypothetical protein